MTDTPTDTPTVEDAPVVTPFVVPTRPVQDGIIDPAWGQWVHDETVRGLKIRAVTLKNVPIDGNGLMVVTAAQLGLATIDGITFSFWQNADPTGQTLQMLPGMIWRGGSNGTSVSLVIHTYVTGTGTMRRSGAGTILEVYVIAYGTAP